MTCTTQCGYYKSKDQQWRKEQNNKYVGVCEKYDRKVSDIFCGCLETASGAVVFQNFEEDSWI